MERVASLILNLRNGTGDESATNVEHRDTHGDAYLPSHYVSHIFALIHRLELFHHCYTCCIRLNFDDTWIKWSKDCKVFQSPNTTERNACKVHINLTFHGWLRKQIYNSFIQRHTLTFMSSACKTGNYWEMTSVHTDFFLFLVFADTSKLHFFWKIGMWFGSNLCKGFTVMSSNLTMMQSDSVN